MQVLLLSSPACRGLPASWDQSGLEVVTLAAKLQVELAAVAAHAVNFPAGSLQSPTGRRVASRARLDKTPLPTVLTQTH